MVKFYEPPVELLAPDKAHLADAIEKFVNGTLNPIQFRAVRVAYGIYEQRKEGTHMIRIRNPAGGITPAQIRKLGEISQRYGAHEYHVTTRQETQLHYVDIKDASGGCREFWCGARASLDGTRFPLKNKTKDTKKCGR